MPALKKFLSSTASRRKTYSHMGGWPEPIADRNRGRRAQVERSAGVSPGALENDGVRSRGVPDSRQSRVAATVSGVGPSGINPMRLARSFLEAKILGRVPTQPEGRGRRKGERRNRLRRLRSD